MSSLTPKITPLYNRVIDLQRGNPFRANFMWGGGLTWPFGTDALITISDNSGTVLDVWEADNTAGNCLSFGATVAQCNLIPAGASWVLTVDLNDGDEPHIFQQGTIVRVEAPFPGQAPVNVLDAVTYSYTFATSGILADPVWNVLTGQPVVYNNSTVNLPNAVAAGAPSVVTLDTGSVSVWGDASPWGQASMMYYAPLPTDAVSLSYNVVNGHGVLGGQTWVIVGAASDMSSGVAFFHQQFSADGQPTVGIATVAGPTTFNVMATANYKSASNDNFLATYNPTTNQYALFLFGQNTPLITWTDAANAVPHGPGYRYLGFSFESGLQAPGVEIANWYANPNVTFTGADLPESHSFVVDSTYTPASWATQVDLVGVGDGGGGNGEDLIDVGFGGLGGQWAATTLTVGDSGPLGIKAGAAITMTVGQGGAGGIYFTPGQAGAGTVFSWPDASDVTQTLTAAGGLGGTLSTANLVWWGLSPGNFSYLGTAYTGGAINAVSGPGHAPGGGGTGGLPLLFGSKGAPGEAWVVDRADIIPGTIASTGIGGSPSGTPPAGSTQQDSNVFTASGTFTPDSWADTIDLVGCGAGGAGHGEDLVDIGIGGAAGIWGATTLTVGGTGPTGIKVGSPITVTVGQGGAVTFYFSTGAPGGATTFSWVDAANAAQTLVCPGGPGGALGLTLTGFGQSPGPLTYQGVDYVGGATQVAWSGNGHVPGGGGGGAAPFLWGGAGGDGQAWIVERQT